jgi:hypothetical protein
MKTKTCNQIVGWVYKEVPTSTLAVGDQVEFTCNRRGRGGHYHVTAIVTKINRKTFQATEAERSYRPGTPWTIYLNIEGLYINKGLEWL